MTSAQVAKVTLVTANRPSQDYFHRDDQILSSYVFPVDLEGM